VAIKAKRDQIAFILCPGCTFLGISVNSARS